MAFASGGQGQVSGPMAQINITPLVDVLLVLLIIFMVTMPMQSHAVKLDLRNGNSTQANNAEPVRLRIDASGAIYWNNEIAALPQLESLMLQEVRQAARAPQLRIATSAEAEYEVLAKVLAAARNADMDNIAFER